MDTITSQPVTLRHSSLNRTGLPNILEKFLPKHHTSSQGMKLQIVFDKQVLLSYFLDRQSESPGLSAFFPQGLAIKKNDGILIFSHTSRLLETPASLWVALFHRYTRSRKKSITLTNRPKTTSDVTPTTLQHKSDKTLPFLL